MNRRTRGCRLSSVHTVQWLTVWAERSLFRCASHNVAHLWWRCCYRTPLAHEGTQHSITMARTRRVGLHKLRTHGSTTKQAGQSAFGTFSMVLSRRWGPALRPQVGGQLPSSAVRCRINELVVVKGYSAAALWVEGTKHVGGEAQEDSHRNKLRHAKILAFVRVVRREQSLERVRVQPETCSTAWSWERAWRSLAVGCGVHKLVVVEPDAPAALRVKSMEHGRSVLAEH